MTAAANDALSAEAIRLHERYTREVIERFNLCPWARPTRLGEGVERFVLLQSDDAREPTLDLIHGLEQRAVLPAVVIAIFPRLRLPPRAFDEFAGRVKQLDQERHGGKPVYVSATFHPDYPLDTRSASAMVPFFRRSPDPSLQIVRLKVIEEARGSAHGTFLFNHSSAGLAELQRRLSTPSVTDRITADNKAQLESNGREAFEAVYADILADRARTYSRFDLS